MTQRRRSKVLAIMACALSGFLAGCSDESPTEDVLPGDPSFVRSAALDVENTSQHGLELSHNVGLNCMSCHQAHGPGKGRFTIAGTLRNPDGSPHEDGTVYLTRTDPGTIADDSPIDAVATIEADRLGNFYSTTALPIPEEPLFVIVERSDGGGRNHMPFPTVSAACNLCHAGSNLATIKE
jgi:hypothetical protein